MYELREIKLEDIEKIRIARNEQIDVLRQSRPITQDEQLAYYNNVVLPNMEKPYPAMILFSIFENQNWIGYGGLVHIDWNNIHAEVSFLVDSKRASNPITYEQDFLNFLKLLAKIAFPILKLHRLYTETFDFREQHMKILEKFGFLPEGRLRDHIFLNNQFHDSIMHGLLEKDVKDAL